MQVATTEVLSDVASTATALVSVPSGSLVVAPLAEGAPRVHLSLIVPTFNDRNDRIALNTIADLFPDRQVVGIHAVDLVWGLGTLHCLTQQQPAGPGQ